MGYIFRFECPKCHYEFDKFDGCGMESVLETYHCTRCQNLVDVLVGIHGRDFTNQMAIEYNKENPEFKKDFFTCSKCKRKKTLSLWDIRTRQCPKCQSKMKKIGKTGLWD